jgi:hypothetical protein
MPMAAVNAAANQDAISPAAGAIASLHHKTVTFDFSFGLTASRSESRTFSTATSFLHSLELALAIRVLS